MKAVTARARLRSGAGRNTHVRGDANVTDAARNRDALAAEVVRRFGERGCVNVVDADGGAARAECGSASLADAARGTGNQRHLRRTVGGGRDKLLQR